MDGLASEKVMMHGGDGRTPKREFFPVPYPHYVVDDLLSPRLLQDIRRSWPGKGYFHPEIPGNYVCNMTGISSEGFWAEFAQNILGYLVVESLGQFMEYIDTRFPGEREVYVDNFSLMQSRGNYGGLDVHNHHYHDPTWVLTMLVYLDQDALGHHGTTLYRTKEGLDVAEGAAQTMQWDDWTEEHLTVDYKGGRLLAIHDCAIAYHGVNPSEKTSQFGRRILRAHVGMPKVHCKRLYGVDYYEYQKKRMGPTKDPEVISWLRTEIDGLANPQPRVSDEARLKWMQSLNVHLHGDAIEPPAAPQDPVACPEMIKTPVRNAA